MSKVEDFRHWTLDEIREGLSAKGVSGPELEERAVSLWETFTQLGALRKGNRPRG